jgi:hypothetical protein
LIIQAARMTLNIKGIKDWNSNKKKVKNGIENVRSHIVSIPNGNIPLGDEKVVFWLTYISLRWRIDVLINTYFLEMNRWCFN